MFVEISILMLITWDCLGYIRFTCIVGQIQDSKFIFKIPAIRCKLYAKFILLLHSTSSL